MFVVVYYTSKIELYVCSHELKKKWDERTKPYIEVSYAGYQHKVIVIERTYENEHLTFDQRQEMMKARREKRNT